MFEQELADLHNAGFVRRDLRCPSGIRELYFDNILLTDKGLRLINVGISALRTKVGETLFEKYLEVERGEMGAFREYFLNR